MSNKTSALDDDFYERLMSLHDGLNDEQSARLNARLVLLLANHVGPGDDLDIILRKARGDKYE